MANTCKLPDRSRSVRVPFAAEDVPGTAASTANWGRPRAGPVNIGSQRRLKAGRVSAWAGSVPTTTPAYHFLRRPRDAHGSGCLRVERNPACTQTRSWDGCTSPRRTVLPHSVTAGRRRTGPDRTERWKASYGPQRRRQQPGSATHIVSLTKQVTPRAGSSDGALRLQTLRHSGALGCHGAGVSNGSFVAHWHVRAVDDLELCPVRNRGRICHGQL